MRGDYHVLAKSGYDGRWDVDALLREYLHGGYNGLNLRDMPAVVKDLGFLAAFDGLRYLEVTGKLSNDAAAFRLPRLEELVLLTKSTRPIRGFASGDVVRLGFDDRPGRELVCDLRCLRELLIWRFRGTDLSFLGQQPPPLRRLRIDGMRQPVTLDGIESCAALEELQVRESRVASLRPLRGLGALRILSICPANQAKGETCLDLEDLLGLTNLEELSLVYIGAVRSLSPLLRMPSLRRLRLGPVEIADADLSPLDELPPHVDLGGQLPERRQRRLGR